ncbi:MAG: hypothetical protein K1X95_01925 [Acidimicrobiia bacterium]|nr:hypothetical protein [Acidimicrobiia bacterium]
MTDDDTASTTRAPAPAPRLWLFDRPVWRDWLLWLAVAGGAASALVVLNGERWYRTSTTPVLTLTLAFAVQFVIGALAVAVVGAVVREYIRGRRE